MKTIVPESSLNVVIESTTYATEKDVKEGDVCTHKIRPDNISIFQDVYGEYGYEKTIRVNLTPKELDKIAAHIKKLREAEFEDEYTDDLPF